MALWEYTRGQPAFNPQDLVDGSERLAEELFSSETKFMSTYTAFNGDRNDYPKGAPEIVLGMCQMDECRQDPYPVPGGPMGAARVYASWGWPIVPIKRWKSTAATSGRGCWPWKTPSARG